MASCDQTALSDEFRRATSPELSSELRKIVSAGNVACNDWFGD